MTDYYLSSGVGGTDFNKVVKNATIDNARAVARKNYTGKPIKVSRITEHGTSTEYLGKIDKWIYIDDYGRDLTYRYPFCWVSKDKHEYILHYNGTLGKRRI